jgi:hypothetical protein
MLKEAKMNRRIIVFIFLILFLVSCAGTQKVEHEVRKPDGSPFPDPIFMLQTIGQEKPIRISFFYSSINYHQDIDVVLVGQQTFLDPRQHVFLKTDDDAKLVVRVLNPRNVRYKVFVTQKIEFSDGGDMQSFHLIGESDMKYREFSRSLPTWKGIERVSYILQLHDENENPLISTRGIKYSIN